MMTGTSPSTTCCGAMLPFALGFILVCLAIAAIAAPAAAHEVRPAYLAIEEDAPGEFDVLFKTPMRGDMRLDLSVAFSGEVENLTPIVSRADRRRHGPDLADQGDRAARRPVDRSSTASRRR